MKNFRKRYEEWIGEFYLDSTNQDKTVVSVKLADYELEFLDHVCPGNRGRALRKLIFGGAFIDRLDQSDFDRALRVLSRIAKELDAEPIEDIIIEEAELIKQINKEMKNRKKPKTEKPTKYLYKPLIEDHI